MWRDPTGRRGRLSRANEVMGTAGIDIFANLFLVTMLLIGSASSDLRLKTGQKTSPEKAQIDVVITRNGVFVANGGPIAIEDLASRIAALGNQPSVRVRVEPAVPIEREHAVLAAVMAGGAVNVSLGLSTGDRP